MSDLLITGDVHTPSGVIAQGAVAVTGARIEAIGSADGLARGDSEVIGAPGLMVLPGFIDLQVNGAGGVLLTEHPTEETVGLMSSVLARSGCTAFLPTVISAPLDQMASAADAVASFASGGAAPEGARVLGAHLEGPFLSPQRAGAHERRFLRAPSLDALRTLLASGRVTLITLAPELTCALDLIDEARARGVVVALGHTEASYEQVEAAMARGAAMVTHLFNAMPPLQARAPGLVGAALASERLYAGLIADRVHVHPANLSLASRAPGAEDRVVLVTDAMPPVGTDAASFQLHGRTVLVRDGACFLDDGTLAGSVLSMNVAVRNMHRLAGVPLPQAIAMASANPARLLGIDGRKGALAEGMDADVLICDGELNVLLTMVEGRIVYRSQSIPRATASA